MSIPNGELRGFIGWVVATLALLLSACGSDGGGGGSTASPPAKEAGRVAILLTDGPADAFDHVWVTITGIELLGDGARVPVFSGDQTVDLLDLRADSMLFSLESGVPAGTYEKIRLTVSRLRLEEPGGEPFDVRLPANGKIDLNPRSPFQVRPGEVVVLELDMDAGKSIHVVEAGSGKKEDRYQFRPVVFVTVKSELPEGKLTRLQGTVARIDAAEQWFLLAPGDLSGQLPPRPEDLDSRWVKVQVGEETSLFNEAGHEMAFAELVAGDVVAVLGRFVPVPDAAAHASPALFNALLIERGIFHRLKGTVVTAPTLSVGTFSFELDAGQGFSGDLVVDAHLFPGTKFLWRSGEPAQWSDLVPGLKARVDAVVYLPSSPPLPDVVNPPVVLQVALVVLEPPEGVIGIEGVVAAVDPGADTLSLTTADGVVHDLVLPDDAHVLILVDGATYQVWRGTQADILAGDSVKVFGRYGPTGRFVVEDVLLFAATPRASPS